MGGVYASDDQEEYDWGPWGHAVDDRLNGHDSAIQRLEQEVIPVFTQEVTDRVKRHDAETLVRLDQFWERQQLMNAESAQAHSVHAASLDLAMGEKLRIAQLELERLLQTITQERENRLRAEMQQAQAAQTEYVEKRTQEVVATGAKLAAVEALLAMGTTSGPQ